MEGSNQVGSSSSLPPRPSSSSSPSFTSDLFGSKDSSSSSAIFSTIFGPPSKAVGREILRNQQKREYSDEKASTSIYHHKPLQPCHLSSSIFYGGQETYSHPQDQDYNSTYKPDYSEDDSKIASRGNWWQGSLYY